MAGAASRNDLGLNFVRQLHKLADVPYQATSWELRGFSWWVGDFRQRIWAEAGVDSEEGEVFKVCAATDFINDLDPADSKLIDRVAKLARAASTSTLVFDPFDRTLRHWTTITLHEDIGSWVYPLMIGSAYSQLAAANSAWNDAQRVLGGKPDQNSRPLRGPDSCKHARVEKWGVECAEEGRNGSAWAGTGEFAEAVELLMQGNIIAKVAGEGLIAGFPFSPDERESAGEDLPADSTAVFEMNTETPHSEQGNGLATRLYLPLQLPEELACHLCTVLNLLETREFTRSCLIGSWGREDGGLVFVGFIPNILYNPGMVANLTLAARARTAWVAEKLGEGERLQAASNLVTSVLDGYLHPTRVAEIMEAAKPRKPGLLKRFFTH
jgi:hypothetical protein